MSHVHIHLNKLFLCRMIVFLYYLFLSVSTNVRPCVRVGSSLG